MGKNIEKALETTFGVEVEMTGITRTKAVKVLEQSLNGTFFRSSSHLDERLVQDPAGRTWKIVSDSSIKAEKRVGNEIQSASANYQVELVTPPLRYREDMNTLQNVIRALRKAGAFANESCGIHIHLDGAEHSVRSLSNFINIIASRDDSLYSALNMPASRTRWCKKMDAKLVERMRREKPKTLGQLENIWYETCAPGRSRFSHYNNSRYQFLNLHSTFQPGGNGTVELRGFNFTEKNNRGRLKLHAGELRAYVAFALAVNRQALDQRSASATPPQSENERFALRTWLVRIGLNGEEFAECRKHLTKHLTGSAAWRHRVA